MTEARLDPGGKGVNVARVLRALGAPAEVIGFLGEANGRLITDHLEQLTIPNRFVAVEGQNRVNLKLVDPGTGELTEVNDLGFTVQPLHLERMTALVRQGLARTRLLVLAGSQPAGVPTTYYRDLVIMGRQAGVRVILDADGEPMRAAMEAQPTLIKPNRDEAGQLLGRTLSTRQDVCEAARNLLALGPEMAVISCGAEGAVIAASGGTWWAKPPSIVPGSTVGAGDSMVAALALALSRGWAPVDALRLATAAGAATASLPGTQVASQADVDRLLTGVTMEEV